MNEYIHWALYASGVLKDVFTTWYVWWPLGILIWFLCLRLYAQGSNVEFGGEGGATIIGSIVGVATAIILPVIVITSPFWLPLAAALCVIILAGFLVNKLLEK